MKIPTLYWSADTDRADATARTIAMWTGIEVDQVVDGLEDPEQATWMFDRLGDRGDHVEWVFDTSITAAGTAARLNAFAEVHGEYPHLVVLDNLSNAVGDPSDEYAEIKKVMSAAQKLAREANPHIALLHHANGKYEDGDVPIPLGGASQNPFKTVELGLTLYLPKFRPGEIAINPVKNRSGQSDRSAQRPIYLPIDFARAQVLGYQKD